MKSTEQIIAMLPEAIQERFELISADENETVTSLVLANKRGLQMFKIVEYIHDYNKVKYVSLYREEIEAINKHLGGQNGPRNK